MAQHTLEVQSGERFEFGKNWARFLGALNEERIAQARKSLSERLELETLPGKTFLDIGSGSGLVSLAARRLGARVHSFDYDPHSVNCTRELKRRYFPDDPQWTIEEGSALDNDYLRSLGTFDVVYSWGVLHHTGDMWTALDNVAPLVREGGILFISLYNDQGTASRRWKKTKKLYNQLPRGLRFPVVAPPAEGGAPGPAFPQHTAIRGESWHGFLAGPDRLGRRIPVRSLHARAGFRFLPGPGVHADAIAYLRRVAGMQRVRLPEGRPGFLLRRRLETIAPCVESLAL